MESRGFLRDHLRRHAALSSACTVRILRESPDPGTAPDGSGPNNKAGRLAPPGLVSGTDLAPARISGSG